MWKRCRSTDKRYPGDNRLIFPKSPYRRDGLAPRCRLVASWGWSRSQGLGCSPIKAVRELGLERKLHCVLLQKCSTINPTYIGGTRTESPNAPRAMPREDGFATRSLGLYSRLPGWRWLHHGAAGSAKWLPTRFPSPSEHRVLSAPEP